MIPLVLIAVMLVTFPIHWFVMINFGGWGYEPFIEITDQSTLHAIELFMQSLFGPFTFVYVAACIAPSRQSLVSIVASFVFVIGVASLALWANSLDSLDSVSYSVVTFLANAAGVIGGIFLIKHREKKVRRVLLVE